MKKYTTITDFIPLTYSEEHGINDIREADGKVKSFKTRKSVENYCQKHKCLYVERKSIFYR
jgi:DNA polymerase III delta prime subunit